MSGLNSYVLLSSFGLLAVTSCSGDPTVPAPSTGEALTLFDNMDDWAGFEGDRGNTTEQIAWLAPLLEKEGGIAEAWSQMGQIESNANLY